MNFLTRTGIVLSSILSIAIIITILDVHTATTVNASQSNDIYSSNLSSKNFSGLALDNQDDIPVGFFTSPAPNAHISREIQSDHDGLDVWDEFNTPILAAADGKVVHVQSSIGSSGGYGYYILLQHTLKTNGEVISLFTLYAHLSKAPAKKVGDVVSQGQQIGFMGNTGNATGTHLHFSIFKNVHFDDRGNLLNPPTCFKRYGSSSSNCLSPLSKPIEIMNYKSGAISMNQGVKKNTSNPAYTSKSLIDMQTTDTHKGATVSEITDILNDILPITSTSTVVTGSSLNTTDNKSRESTLSYELTRSQFAKLVLSRMRSSETATSKLPETIVFKEISDVAKEERNYSAIQRMTSLGIITLDQNNSYRPDDTITRKEAAGSLAKLSELIYSE